MVALGAMRNVEAGARIFFSLGFGMLAVWDIGSVAYQHDVVVFTD